MVEDIVFVILVILAIGAGVWVWRMEVSGKPIVPPTKSAKAQSSDEEDNSSKADTEAS